MAEAVSAGVRAPFTVAEVLMCPPTYYTTSFFLNPWCRYWEDVDTAKASAQWDELRETLEGCGAAVRLLEPLAESPAMVFTADTAIAYAPRRSIVLRNDGPRSDVEASAVRRWLEADGFLTEGLPPSFTVDGGNVLRWAPDEYLIGLKPGGTGRAEGYVSKVLKRVAGARMRPIALQDRRFLHLDTVVGNLGGRSLLVYWDGVMPLSRAYLTEQVGLPVIDVTREDAERFACNCITVGSHVITGPIGDPLVEAIELAGFEVHRVDLSEFYKAGGGAKCLTLPLRYGVVE